MNTEAMRGYIRVCRMRCEAARERLMKATEMMEEWEEQVKLEESKRDVQEHNVKVFTQLLMARDQEFSRQEQARKRERSKDARGKRRDVDERLRLLAYLKTTKYERSVVDAPPGSMPGSSGGGVPPPPKERAEHDREVEGVEDLLDEM